jgi:hypothetical protein
MKDTIAKITKWILYVLIAIAAVAGLLFYAGLLSTELFLNIGKLILIIGLIIMILSPIYGFITNPQNLKVLLISLVVGAVVLIISYSIAGNEYTALQLEQYNISEQTSKFVGMGLYATYIMFGLAVLAFLYSAISKAIK